MVHFVLYANSEQTIGIEREKFPILVKCVNGHALGTRDLRRVKIGIGRPGAPGEKRAQVSDHVLSPFYPEEHEAIEAACAEAADLALELVERGPRG